MSVTTNTTTYFYRESDALEALVASLPRRGARVWLVGCATGDEAYTLAILAREAGVDLEITASDINPRALEAAALGRYNVRHLRRVPDVIRERYFTRVDDRYHVRHDLLPPMRFVLHDITSGEAFPDRPTRWDGVLCRHVLVYLDTAQSQRALLTLAEKLGPKAPLVLAGAEWLGVGTRIGTLAAHASLELEPLIAGRTPLCYRRSQNRALAAVARAAAPVDRPMPPGAGGTRPTGAIDGLMRAGERALDRGDLVEALARFEECAIMAPQLAAVHLRIGITHMISGERSRATLALMTALDLVPESWPSLMLLGDMAAPDSPRNARVFYERALRALQRQIDVPNELGVLHTLWPDRATLIAMLQGNIRAAQD